MTNYIPARLVGIGLALLVAGACNRGGSTVVVDHPFEIHPGGTKLDLARPLDSPGRFDLLCVNVRSQSSEVILRAEVKTTSGAVVLEEPSQLLRPGYDNPLHCVSASGAGVFGEVLEIALSSSDVITVESVLWVSTDKL